MTRRTLLSAGVLFLCGLALAGLAQSRQRSIPTPSDFLGVAIGGDGVLADYDQIVSYWREVSSRSDRIALLDLGETTMGRPYVLAVMTSPENQQRLEEFRAINNRLYDPRRTSDAEARSLVARGRTIVAIQMGIHSDEVGAPQASLELAHRFATDNSAWMRQVLDETIILLSPSHNPDGAQLVAEWHERTRGTPYYGGPLPFLYHPYVGHDNNRDWYMFTQKESRLTVERIWNAWHPQISYDLHQMEPDGARMFLPPYLDPVDPNIDPILRAQTAALGRHVAAALLGQGKTGVVTNAIYDLWTPARAYVDYHGGVRILSEVASARLAAPITLSVSSLRRGLGYDATQPSANFPSPWPGGTWRLRDIIDYQVASVEALVGHAAHNRESWLTNFWRVNTNAVGPIDPVSGERKPYAVIVPAEQHDPAAAGEMLRVFQAGDVEVHRARAAFAAGGTRYRAGSHVILMAQPASAFARTLTQVQHYPDVRAYPGGPPQRPYDATAYTIPLLMGAAATPVAAPFDADLELMPAPLTLPAGGGRVPAASAMAYTVAHDSAGIKALIRLLRDGAQVGWAGTSFRAANRAFDAGTLVVAGNAGARERLADLADHLPLTITALDRGVPGVRPLRLPRVGLYRSPLAAIDEGWTRWIFEQWGLPYLTLGNGDVQDAGRLGERFDVVVLPDQSPGAILHGISPGQAPLEYVGGIGETGLASLRGFVEAGGTLVTLDSASMLPIERFGLPVVNVVASAAREVVGPGSILRTRVDASHPVGFGSPIESMAWFEHSPAFRVSGNARAIVRYPDAGSPLLSGWLLGGEELRGAAAVVEVPLGRGRVVLFGFRPQYRAQTWATFGLFFNALFYSTTGPS